MHRYKNGFYRPGIGRQEYLTTDSKPVKHGDCLIYYRIKSSNPWARCFDIVKNGVCVGMMAGLDGAKRRIDVV